MFSALTVVMLMPDEQVKRAHFRQSCKQRLDSKIVFFFLVLCLKDIYRPEHITIWPLLVNFR